MRGKKAKALRKLAQAATVGMLSSGYYATGHSAHVTRLSSLYGRYPGCPIRCAERSTRGEYKRIKKVWHDVDVGFIKVASRSLGVMP